MRTVVFAKISATQLDNLLFYLEARFSLQTKKKFALKFNGFIKIISEDPETFKKSDSNVNLRKCVISKQTTLYYKFNNNQIRILSVFDTRQNPTKIKNIK